MASKQPSTAKTKKAPPKTSNYSEDEIRGMIAEAAFYHAEHRGFQGEGADIEQDWYQAEAEINALLNAGKMH